MNNSTVVKNTTILAYILHLCGGKFHEASIWAQVYGRRHKCLHNATCTVWTAATYGKLFNLNFKMQVGPNLAR